MQYPSQLPFIELDFYYSEDFRPGYERHTIANITWSPPAGIIIINYQV